MLSRRLQQRDANFFKNKYLEKRLQQTYKSGGIDRQEDISRHTHTKHKEMMTFYSKTFADFAGTFKIPKRNLNAMPPVIQSSLQSKAFSKIYVPHFVKVPTRELYDRDNFETDQYSKMLYVESKMDRMIKRQKVADERAHQISKNIQRVTINKRNKAKIQFESGEDN